MKKHLLLFVFVLAASTMRAQYNDMYSIMYHNSPDVQPAQVALHDLQGRLVRTQQRNLEHIDMSQLPAGTYTLRVTLEDGKTYSDKVVKE